MTIKNLQDLLTQIKNVNSRVTFLRNTKTRIMSELNKDYISINSYGFSEKSVVDNISFDSTEIDKEIADLENKLKILIDKRDEVEKTIQGLKSVNF